jgi:hypothetical protein
VMDCVDCHNRPTHIYRPAGNELDAAMDLGRIDPSLPYIRREGRKVLEQDYASHEEARAGIRSAITAFYNENYPDLAVSKAPEIDRAITAMGDIFAVNVFPVMQVGWNTYPNHIGHERSPGCFRCHNDEHTAADGSVISQDCDTCHSLLAMEETNPEILEMLNP